MIGLQREQAQLEFFFSSLDVCIYIQNFESESELKCMKKIEKKNHFNSNRDSKNNNLSGCVSEWVSENIKMYAYVCSDWMK